MSEPIDLIVVLKSHQPASMPRLRELLHEQARLSRLESGCLRFEVYESTTVADTFILVERWESQEALDAHRKATGFVTIYQPLVLPLVERTPHVCRPLNSAIT